MSIQVNLLDYILVHFLLLHNSESASLAWRKIYFKLHEESIYCHVPCRFYKISGVTWCKSNEGFSTYVFLFIWDCNIKVRSKIKPAGKQLGTIFSLTLTVCDVKLYMMCFCRRNLWNEALGNASLSVYVAVLDICTRLVKPLNPIGLK